MTDAITAEEALRFAEKYVLRSATLENEVADLKKELKLADECVADLRKEYLALERDLALAERRLDRD